MTRVHAFTCLIFLYPLLSKLLIWICAKTISVVWSKVQGAIRSGDYMLYSIGEKAERGIAVVVH